MHPHLPKQCVLHEGANMTQNGKTACEQKKPLPHPDIWSQQYCRLQVIDSLKTYSLPVSLTHTHSHAPTSNRPTDHANVLLYPCPASAYKSFFFSWMRGGRAWRGKNKTEHVCSAAHRHHGIRRGKQHIHIIAVGCSCQILESYLYINIVTSCHVLCVCVCV